MDKETYRKNKRFAGEKKPSMKRRLMRRAFDLQLSTIVVLRNGFTPLSKPKGEQFDACAHGRLLMLSAWEHLNERITLTAHDCQQMNLMALELAGE